MLSVLRDTWALYISMTLILLGLGFQNTIIPIRAVQEGFAESVVSYIMTMYYVGFFAGVSLVPKMLRNVGHIRVFATLATLSSSMIILLGLSVDPFAWLSIRFIMGFCYSGLYLITESWINDSVDNNSRGQALSVYLLLMYLGNMSGQFSIEFIDVDNLDSFVWVSLVLSLAFIPVLLTASRQPNIENIKPLSLKQTYKTSPMGFVGLGFVGMGNALSFAIAGVYITSFGVGPVQVSLFLLSGTFGTVLGLYPGGKLSDIIDRRFVIILLSGISILGVFLLSLQNTVSYMLYASFALINFGLGPLYSVCLAQTNDWLKVEERMPAAARLGFIYGVGSVIGGMVSSYLIGIFSIKIFIYMQFFIYGGLLIFAVIRVFIRDRQVEDRQAVFIPYPSRANAMHLDVYDDDIFDNSANAEQEKSNNTASGKQ